MDRVNNLPHNVMMLITATSVKDEEWLIEELGKFILFLKELCPPHPAPRHRLSKDRPDHPATVQNADVTCIRLY